MTAADRIAELEERVAYLEGELALVVSTERIHLIRSRLGVTKAQAHLVLALHDMRGRPLTVAQLDERIPEAIGRGERAGLTVRALVYQIRQRLGAGVIETIGSAYRISGIGAIQVASALDQHQDLAA